MKKKKKNLPCSTDLHIVFELILESEWKLKLHTLIFYFSKLCRGDFCVARFWWFFLALREASWIRGGFLHARVCASPITTSHMEKST